MRAGHEQQPFGGALVIVVVEVHTDPLAERAQLVGLTAQIGEQLGAADEALGLDEQPLLTRELAQERPLERAQSHGGAETI